jgi:hypothetical protein
MEEAGWREAVDVDVPTSDYLMQDDGIESTSQSVSALSTIMTKTAPSHYSHSVFPQKLK